MFTYTTEHIDNTHILVRVYKKGSRKIYHKFIVEYYGDWNEVDNIIETTIESL